LPGAFPLDGPTAETSARLKTSTFCPKTMANKLAGKSKPHHN